MDAMEFLPGLTPKLLDEHRSWLEPAALEPATGKLIFCFQSYLVRTPHHVVLIDSCVGNDKNRPTRPSWHMKTDQTYMSALASAGIAVEDNRLCDVYPSAPRPRRLEHAAREWTLGANIPARPLCVLRSRARLLDGTKRARSGRLHRRQRSADRRGKSGRAGPQRPRPQRSCPIAADARAYARPFRRAPRQVRPRRRRDRRSYPLTLAGPLSRALVQTRLRSTASRPDPPRIFGTVLRQRNTVLHGPFSITVGGSYRPVGRRISLRDRRGRAISARGAALKDWSIIERSS